MGTKASTHRLDPQVQAALDHLSMLLRRPKNRLINEAVRLYVQQKSREMEQELEGTLRALRAYRRKDADFEDSIDAFAQEEARLARNDPAEGKSQGAGQKSKPEQGLVRTQIRRRLHAA